MVSTCFAVDSVADRFNGAAPSPRRDDVLWPAIQLLFYSVVDKHYNHIMADRVSCLPGLLEGARS